MNMIHLIAFLGVVDPWLSQTTSASVISPSDPWTPAAAAQPLSKPNQEFDEFSLLGNRSVQTSMCC